MQRFVPAAPAGIRFSHCVFSEPVPLARWWPPAGAGLYVVLIPDFTWGPRPFQPVWFGEFGQLTVPVSQDEFLSWFRVAAGRDLYIAALPGRPAEDLAPVRAELIRAYRPVCNRGGDDTAPGELARRVEALEKRGQEHEALLRVVLAAMGKLLEPAPEPRKRHFGFHRGGPAPRTPGATASGT